jgi:dipeptidyl-peptidase-4
MSGQSEKIDLKGVFQGKYRYDNLRGLKWQEDNLHYSYTQNDSMYQFDYKTNAKIFLPKEVKKTDYKTLYEELDNDSKNHLFVTKNEGYVFVESDLYEGKAILLCPDTGKHIVFGETVHRSEWGIDEGQYFSPKGNFIAFYRMDESMVEDYPLVDVTAPIAEVYFMKYPMAGRTSHQVKVGIFDVKDAFSKNQTVYHYIETDLEDGEFLTNVTFSPDEKFLYITHLNRAQNHSKLIKYDLLAGKKLAVLIEEKDDRYVEPQKRIIFLKNGNFIYHSDRDGWMHCYLYSGDGKLIKQLTSGNFAVDAIGLDDKEEYLYFNTHKDFPVDHYIYRVNIKKGTYENLTPERGTHHAIFNHDKSAFFDYFNNTETPQKIILRNNKGKILKELCASKNPYQNCNLGKTEIFSIQNKEGDALYCRMIYPQNFDPQKKYPVFLYVYGGPHSQLVTNSFMSGGVFLQYMAQQGYLVFTLDNRGTGHRGADFEKCIHRNLGVKEVEDQLCGVKYLKSLPYVDADHIGLDGWSYGGFMVLSLITAEPNTFKAASCGGPVVDWSKYEVMYGERYMDTPEENPLGYANANILNKVEKINCPLLVMHGAQDHTVVWQHTLQLLNKAIEKGIELDYFVYPNHDHNVSGTERVHLWNKIEQFHNQ